MFETSPVEHSLLVLSCPKSNSRCVSASPSITDKVLHTRTSNPSVIIHDMLLARWVVEAEKSSRKDRYDVLPI
jgi:hypothetical protein